MLLLWIQEHGKSSHLLRSPLISFPRGFNFLSYVFSLLGSSYAKISYIIVMDVGSLMFFSAHLSFVKRKPTVQFELILCTVNLIKSLIKYRSTVVGYVGCLYIPPYHLQRVKT